MPELTIDTNKIVENISTISNFLGEHGVGWTLVGKILCGHEPTLTRILDTDVVKTIHSIGDSRIQNLKRIKEIAPSVQTLFIKPPSLEKVDMIVQYADISLNSSIITIKNLNEAAKAIGIVHKVIIMIELGELREGVVRDDIVDFYSQVFNLSNIEVIGLGANLGCLYGIQPNYDKLVQLTLYKSLLESMFDRTIPIISGGSSITLPLVGSNAMPKPVNHLRIGEAVFMGTTPYDGNQFDSLHTDIFKFRANIIELALKSSVPDGTMSDGNIGHLAEESPNDQDSSLRAIVDFGLIDVDAPDLTSESSDVSFIGTTSDMTVYEIKKEHGKHQMEAGDSLNFKPSYMGVARLMHSEFVDKVVL